MSTTENGITCQKWTEQYPQRHDDYTPEKYPNGGLGDHNFCRNPDEATALRPWCYTIDINVRWEYCDVGPRQAECPGTGISGMCTFCMSKLLINILLFWGFCFLTVIFIFSDSLDATFILLCLSEGYISSFFKAFSSIFFFTLIICQR